MSDKATCQALTQTRGKLLSQSQVLFTNGGRILRVPNALTAGGPSNSGVTAAASSLLDGLPRQVGLRMSKSRVRHGTSANDRPESAFRALPEGRVEFRRRQLEHGSQVGSTRGTMSAFRKRRMLVGLQRRSI